MRMYSYLVCGESAEPEVTVGDIKTQSLKDFSSAFISLSNEEAVNELLSSAYSVSAILAIKYRMLKRSTLCISLALLLWVLVQVNKFLA